MSFSVRFVLVINIVFVYISVAVVQDIMNINSCWNSDIHCNIEGQFARKGFEPFLVNINCDDSADYVTMHSGVRRFIGIQTIILNGCNVARNSTIGVEHIDDPNGVTHLTIKFFKVKQFYSEHFDKFKFLATLQLINNVFEEIINESFQDINSVETLVIANNNLKFIAPYALTALNNLKNLTIIEPNLSIEVLNYTLCESLKHIILELYAYEWQILSSSLETLQITNTKLTFGVKRFGIKDFENLTEISITHSQFKEFPILESRTLKLLNLTQNKLHQFPENDLPNVENLDLSGNLLREIDSNALKSMVRLREIYVENNLIGKISKTAFDSNTHLEIIKISGNRLKSIQFIEYLAQTSLKIFIDDNPWSCMWVLNVSSEHPTIFAIFHYNKFSNKNKVNVNGLNCLFYDVNGYNVYESSIATEIIPISSTLPFAENIEISYRRNPKDTALITLIILVVGVAVLFFLLYLHIKCRQNTVEPFYRSLPYDAHPHQMSDRIDIVRRNLPPTDYEAPIATTDTDLKEVIYEQIREKYTNYERIPEKFVVHDGFDDVNSVVSYKIAIKNSES